MESQAEENELLIGAAQEQEAVDFNYEIHIEKIMNFQAITQTTNTDLAAKYLVRNNWDESAAAKDYYDELDRRDFENAQRMVYAAAQQNVYQEHNAEGEALIDNNLNAYANQPRNQGPGFFGYIFGFFGTIGTGISYIIPNFIKTPVSKLFSLFSTPFPSHVFVQGLLNREIVNQVNQHNPELAIDFKQEYFINAVADGKSDKKPILFILVDTMIEDNQLVLREIFNDEETLKILSKNYIVFGLETGSQEANAYTQEFGIDEIPYFGTIICKSDTEYDVIESYKHDEFELEKFKDFLNACHLTFESLIQYIGEDNIQEDFPIGGGVTMDETRRLKEQQRMDYMKAQEEDMIKLTNQAQKEELKQKEEEDKVNYEISKQELAQRKKSELPPEPEEGSVIKFREPLTGKNFTRKFNNFDSIQVLYDYVESKLDEIQFENR